MNSCFIFELSSKHKLSQLTLKRQVTSIGRYYFNGVNTLKVASLRLTVQSIHRTPHKK